MNWTKVIEFLESGEADKVFQHVLLDNGEDSFWRKMAPVLAKHAALFRVLAEALKRGEPLAAPVDEATIQHVENILEAYLPPLDNVRDVAIGVAERIKR